MSNAHDPAPSDDALADPHDPRARAWHASTRALVAFLGSWGAVVGVWPNGPNGQRGAVALVLAAIGVSLATTSGRWPMRAVCGVAALTASALSIRYVGRAPAVVVCIGVLGAAFVSGWRPARPRVAASDVAALVLVAAQVVWWQQQGTLAYVVLVCGALVLCAPVFADLPPLRGADRVLRRVRRSVMRSVAVLAVAVVAAPLLYLPGAVAGAVARARSAGRRSTWTPVTRSAVDHRRGVRYPFIAASGARPLRRTIVGVAATVAVVCAGALVVDRVLDTARGAGDGLGVLGDALADSLPGAAADGSDQFLVRASDLPAFDGAPWADDLAAEHLRFTTSDLLVPSDSTVTRLRDFSGRFTTVVDGQRRTILPPACECPEIEAWLVGGSGAFGIGQRDEHTVASELVRLASDDGVSLTVQNMSTPGWTIHQEYQAVLDRLESGAAPPDLVIFLGGANDVAATLFASAAGQLDPDEPALLDAAQAQRFLSQERPTLGSERDVVMLGELAAGRYERVRARAAQELGELGVRTEFFFQPDAFATEVQRGAIELNYGRRPGVLAGLLAGGPAFEVAARTLSPAVHDLRGVFDAVDEQVFIDTLHTNELGARIQAEAVYEQLIGRDWPARR